MKVRRTRVVGFGPHDDLSVDWDQYGPVVAVVAPNGRGKTFLVDAPFAALYGYYPGYAGSLYDALTQNGTGSGRIEIDVDYAGTRYTITRQVATTAKTKTTTATATGPDGKVVAGPQVRAFDAWAVGVFGPPEVALATWHSPYGFRGDLCNIQPVERSAIVKRCIDVSTIVRASTLADAEAKRSSASAAALERAVGTHDPDSTRRMIDEAEQLLAVAETTITRERAEADEIASRLTTAVELLDAVNRAGQEVARRAQVDARIASLRAVPAPNGERPPDLPKPTNPVEPDASAYTESARERDEARAAVTRLTTEGRIAADALAAARADQFAPPLGIACLPCPLLKDRPDPDALEARVKDLRAQYATAHAASEEAAQVAARIEAEYYAEREKRARAHDALLTEYRASVEAADAWDRTAAAYRLAQAEITRLEAEAGPAPEYDPEEAAGMTAKVAELRTLDAAVRSLVSSGTVRAAELRASIEAHRRSLDSALRVAQSLAQERRRADLARQLSVAFGRTGLQALAVESAIKPLEEAASRLMRDVTDGAFDCRIGTTRDTTDGGTQEQVSILVADARGERDVARFSGGERRVFAPVLRFATADWVETMTGREARTFVFDEVFDAVHPENADRIVESCERAAPPGSQVILVTPDADYAARIPSRLVL